MNLARLCVRLAILALLLLTTACAGLRHSEFASERSLQYVSVSQDETLLTRFAPVFLLENSDRSYNRIGTPAIRAASHGQPEAYVDSKNPSIYTQVQTFVGKSGEYSNLIYRVHFEKTPLPHLTWGQNVGLIVIITLNQDDQPLLLTTAHTCGCYLGIIPTSYLSETAYPANWSYRSQSIYGETLPGHIDLTRFVEAEKRFVLRIRSGTHRVKNVELQKDQQIRSHPSYSAAVLKPMAELRKLPFLGSEVSFFETEGPRKGYVRNSHKFLERLLMSWWALDWRIGEDKDFGPKEQTGTTFYTSLKPWARDDSDLWNFSNFLNYWGWKL